MDDAEFRALQGQFGLPPGYRGTLEDGTEVAQPASRAGSASQVIMSSVSWWQNGEHDCGYCNETHAINLCCSSMSGAGLLTQGARGAGRPLCLPIPTYFSLYLLAIS